MHNAPNDYLDYYELYHGLSREYEASNDKWHQLVDEFYRTCGGVVALPKSWKTAQGGDNLIGSIEVMIRSIQNSTILHDDEKQKALNILRQLRSMAPEVARRMTMKYDKNNKRYDNTVQSVFRHKEKRSKN